jgi:hypothetical protein
MTATDTVSGNVYLKKIEYDENCRKMNVPVIILALLKKIQDVSVCSNCTSRSPTSEE